MLKRISLPWLVTVELVIWAGLCCLINGPAVLGYIALHLATTGVFLLLMHQALRRSQRLHQTSASARHTDRAEFSPQREPARTQLASRARSFA